MTTNTPTAQTVEATVTGEEPASTTIALALEDASSERGQRPPLFDSIDAEALDNLVTSGRESDLAVSFTHAGHRITVDPDGTVTVAPERR